MIRAHRVLVAVPVLILMGVGVTRVLGQARVGFDGTEFARVTPETVKWMDYPGEGVELGIKQAYIYGDPSKPGLYIIRIKFPAGVMSRPHTHPETRIGTVIQGTWWTGTGDTFDPKSTTAVPAGSVMVHPAGKAHYDGSRGEETIVQLMGIGPTGKTMAHAGEVSFSKQ